MSDIAAIAPGDYEPPSIRDLGRKPPRKARPKTPRPAKRSRSWRIPVLLVAALAVIVAGLAGMQACTTCQAAAPGDTPERNQQSGD